MSPDGFKTQVLLLHSDQSTLDKLGSEFDPRYTVHFATSGSQALKALAEAPIDIFVSASDLPGMSGLEALREAKMRSPQTLGILLGDATADKGAASVGGEVFPIVGGDVTGEALFELVENATRQMHLPVLSKSANDTTARVNHEPEHIVMETAGDGSAIISQSSARLRALNPDSFAAVSPIDILVLTKDTEFLETIRSSLGNMHKVLSAAALPEAEDIIRNHEVGVAVVDAAVVRDKIKQLTQHLRREAPRLVSIITGRREDGEMLIDLVNRGNVYRFLLKPVSSGRARLAVAASVKHHLEAPDAAFIGRDNAAEPPPAAPESASHAADVPKETATAPIADAPANNEVVDEPGEDTNEPEATDNSEVAESLSKTGAFRMAELAAAESRAANATRRFGKLPVIGAVAAVLAMIAIGVFFLAGQSEENLEPEAATEPATNAPAVAEVDVVFRPPAVDKLISVAETALLDSRLLDADAALQRVTVLDPANARLPFLTAQLEQARVRLRLNEARAAIREGRFEDASDALSAAQSLTAVSGSTEFETLTAELNIARNDQKIDALLALANASLESGALLSPPDDNARYYYELVLSNDPENPAAQQGLIIIAARESAMAALAAANLAEANEGPLAQPAEDPVAATQPITDAKTASQSEVPLAAAIAAVVEADDVQAVDMATPDGNAAPEAIVADTSEPVPLPVADEKPTLELVPAAVSSLVRTKYVAPKYPRNAVRRNLSGWVDIEFTVSVDGTVKDAGARASEPGDVFVESAAHAVEQWEFEPVLSNGVVVEKRAAVRMMFSLD